MVADDLKERKPRRFDGPLVVREQSQVVVHDVAAGDREGLDIAEPGQRLLLVSYGSGAGSDAFSLSVTDRLVEARDKAPCTQDYIERRTEVDYATYARFRGKLTLS